MPSIKIGSTSYHLAFRTITRCQLRTQDHGHYVVAQGEAICLPSDPFDEKEGKRRAFAEMIKDLRRVSAETHILHEKRERRRIWSQFLFWLSGKTKPKYKMKKKPVKLTPENHGEPTPLARGTDQGLSLSADKAEQLTASGQDSVPNAGLDQSAGGGV